MRVAVGIVYHQDTAPIPELGADIEVLTRINAGQESPWLGFGANHNRLIARASDADWYVALNPDIEVDSHTIMALVRAAERNQLDVCGPRLVSPWGVSNTAQAAYPGARRWLREAVLGTGRGDEQSRQEPIATSAWISGACMAIRLTGSSGSFNERYFMYFEDVDLCRSTWQAGGRVGVHTGLSVVHRSGWQQSDPLISNRGVQFARSALEFGSLRSVPRLTTRAIGLARFGSRILLPRRASATRAAARAIATGFAAPDRLPGLEELAEVHNGELR